MQSTHRIRQNVNGERSQRYNDDDGTQMQLEVHGRARREAARRRKSECKINLSPM